MIRLARLHIQLTVPVLWGEVTTTKSIVLICGSKQQRMRWILLNAMEDPLCLGHSSCDL